MLSHADIAAYNKTRIPSARGLLCHAPFSSLNFEQNGNVTACCYNRSFQLGHIPEDTLEDIWFGKRAEQLRSLIRANDLSGGCSACAEQIKAGNHQGTKAIYYDEFAQTESLWGRLAARLSGGNRLGMPKVFEFELSNSCNLECTMCNGYFSSAIRKNREQLPPIKNHYTERFVHQLEPFIPHLTDAKFLGGEPFLIDIYYRIWDLIIAIKPEIKVHITTNATVLNKKVKDYLERMRAGLVLSIDTINRPHYEQIRINADYQQVMENLAWFREYTLRKKTYLSIAACPIRTNRFDMPDLVRFCNERDIHLHLNTVWTPEDQSLRFMSAKELGELVQAYESSRFEVMNSRQQANVNHFRSFIGQVKAWKQEAEAEESLQGISGEWRSVFSNILQDTPQDDLLHLVAAHYLSDNPDAEKLQEQLKALMRHLGAPRFLETYSTTMKSFSEYAVEASLQGELENKIKTFSEVFKELERPEDMAEEIIRTGFVYQFRYFQQYPLEQIMALTRNRFRMKTPR